QRFLRYQRFTDVVNAAVNAFNEVGISIDACFEDGEKYIEAIVLGLRCHGLEPAHRLGKRLDISLPVSKKNVALENEGHVLHRELDLRRDKSKVDFDRLLRLEKTRATLNLLDLLRG